jgi:restriction endonuclease Mrr
MKMHDSPTQDLTRFLGSLVEDLVEGRIQVRLSRDELLTRIRSFLKRKSASDDPRILLETWTTILNHAVFYKNYLIKYVPAVDSVSFQWVPPWESISWATELRGQNLRKEVCEAISNLSFEAFEHLMRQVFARIAWAKDISVTKVSHDDGIDFDGKFAEKSSGLLLPLLGQAKHWKTKIGSEAIRTFLGSIAVRNDHRNTVGVYVATGGFTEDASRMIRKSPNHIIWMDLDRLADLMITNRIGVASVSIKGMNLDSGFWNDLNV